jgi:threonine aldolase
MTVVDLRSDTVSRPTPAMRRAMADAAVGDDVYGEDPTVRELEQETAALLGKEAALFVPSGTMSNQIGLSLLAGRGTRVVLEAGSHIVKYEAGAAAALWGITLHPVSGERGVLSPGQIDAALSPEDVHVAPVRAVAAENTHNRAGGAVWPRDALDAFCNRAAERGLRVHLDGARLWNAVVAGGTPADGIVRGADTVSVCFSKGLGAPVGSALVSSRENVARGRFLRKQLGGGMRQAGIIAAGALFALRHHRPRLADDHARAARIGKALEDLGMGVLPVETNLVIADLGPADSGAVTRALRERGILIGDLGRGWIRIVTHLDVDDAGADRTIDALRAVLRGRGAAAAPADGP